MHNCFESQVVQIAALGVWHMVTGKPMTSRLEQVEDPRWDEKIGLFITLKKGHQIRGSVGVLESSSTLIESLFDAGGVAATHDSRFAPITAEELFELDIEVSLVKNVKKITEPSEIVIGTSGLIVMHGEKQGLLLPDIPVTFKWSADQFLEACCEKAQLSHKAWRDPNTMIETFETENLKGGSLFDAIQDFVELPASN